MAFSASGAGRSSGTNNNADETNLPGPDLDLPGPSSSRVTEPTFINRNGGIIFIRAGHQYSKLRQNKDGTSIWRCTSWRKSCKGSFRVSPNGHIMDEKSHCSRVCSPNFIKNEFATRMADILNKVTTTQEKIVGIYEENISEFENSGFSLIQEIPEFQSVKSTLYRARNNAAGVSKMNFRDVNEIEIPKIFEKFLVADYHDKTTKILLFCSPDLIPHLHLFEHVFLDGTFKSCPKHFSELYVLLGDVNSSYLKTNVVPLMYALVTNKKKETYKILFQLIKARIPNLKPKKITLDFEKAAMGALKEEYPTAELKGCYFHFSQAVWKKGRQLKLTKLVETKKTVALSALLPLLPIEYINEAWEYIQENAYVTKQMQKEIDEFVIYMKKQWLKKEEWIQVWSVNKELHRTNNPTEAWNSKLNRKIMKKEPTLVMLLKVLKQDSCSAIKQISTEGTPKKQKYISRNRWIDYILEQLENKDISVGHCLEKLRK